MRERFALDPQRLEAIPNGHGHRLFRHGDLVVRFELAAPESVRWEHGLVRFLAAHVPEVPAPIASEGAVSLWPYVAGAPARGRHEPHAVAAAALLRRLHDAGRNWTGGQRPGARETAGSGDRGPIHGDFHGANVLVSRGRITGVVDWEDSCVDLLVYDLAIAVWQFCVSKRADDFDRRIARAMLDAYGSELAPDDLVPLILVRLRRELDLFRSPEDEPYRRHLRKAIARLDG